MTTDTESFATGSNPGDSPGQGTPTQGRHPQPPTTTPLRSTGNNNDAAATNQGGVQGDPHGGTTAKGNNEFHKPTKPIMGGLTLIASEQFAAWVGGKPKATWSGLDNVDPLSIEPTQYRPTSIGSASKASHYHIQGLKNKFKRSEA